MNPSYEGLGEDRTYTIYGVRLDLPIRVPPWNHSSCIPMLPTLRCRSVRFSTSRVQSGRIISRGSYGPIPVDKFTLMDKLDSRWNMFQGLRRLVIAIPGFSLCLLLFFGFFSTCCFSARWKTGFWVFSTRDIILFHRDLLPHVKICLYHFSPHTHTCLLVFITRTYIISFAYALGE